MKSPFGGGYSIATIVYPETKTVLCGAVPFEYDVTMGKVYEWEFATVRDGGVTYLASIAEMAQIARFFDGGSIRGINSHRGAMAQLKAYVYFAALVYKQAQTMPLIAAA